MKTRMISRRIFFTIVTQILLLHHQRRGDGHNGVAVHAFEWRANINNARESEGNATVHWTENTKTGESEQGNISSSSLRAIALARKSDQLPASLDTKQFKDNANAGESEGDDTSSSVLPDQLSAPVDTKQFEGDDISSALPLTSTVKMRTTPNAPFRVFLRQPSSNRAARMAAKKTKKLTTANNADNLSTPSDSPAVPIATPNALSSLPACPPTYDPRRNNYVAGDGVETYNTLFTCRSSPYEDYCNIATLEEAKLIMLLDDKKDKEDNENYQEQRMENMEKLWLNAWEEVGECAPAGSASNVPTMTAADEGTPLEQAEFSLSSNAPTYLSANLNVPSKRPSMLPTRTSSELPSSFPSTMPSESNMPTELPTENPSDLPTYVPTLDPTSLPTYVPTTSTPTYLPTTSPTDYPTLSPTTSKPTVSPTPPPTSEPTFSPTPSPLALSPTAYTDYDEQLLLTENNIITTSCKSNQIHLRLELVTDFYPEDTSWQFIDRTANVILLSSPIGGYSGKELGNGMMESQLDIREICLDLTATAEPAASAAAGPSTNNKYEFILKDHFGDGLCCQQGVEPGYYKLMQRRKNDNENNTEDEWKVLVAGSQFKTKMVQHFFELRHDGRDGRSSSVPDIVQSILEDGSDVENTNNTTASSTTSLEILCPSPQRKITIQIQTDRFGNDTSWSFRVKGGPIIAKNERTYEKKVQVDNRDVCIEDASLYEFTVHDAYGDGMCCAYKDGYYRILTHHPMSDIESKTETILHGGYFMSDKITHLINTTMPAISDRDTDWLDSHNTRRKYWHEYYNTSYIPLLWSESLKAEAKIWSDSLLDSCGEGMHHDPQRTFGENVAGNYGSGSWGTRRHPEKILARFVEYEVDDPWPENSHLTQALWRASKYVGCAESHKSMGGVKECHTQVCRYARTGNCNMGAFKNDDGTIDWKSATLEDASYCGPICPTDGCRA